MPLSQILWIWLLAYALPAGSASVSTQWLTRKAKTPQYNQPAIHTALFISICISHYFIHALDMDFPWAISTWGALAIVAGTLLSTAFIGAIGLWYLLSALVQELTMLSIAFILLPFLPVYVVILLIIPIFVVAHFIYLDRWKLRGALLFIWGVASITLFAVGVSLYFIVALHAVLGSFFISKSVLGIRGTSGEPSGWLR